MKIAVTYQNGQLSGHFGHAEMFKVYETDESKIISSQLLEPQGGGHAYMSGLMQENGVQAVICTSMGVHAKEALHAAGIEVVIGVTGDPDEAVEAYLKGELISEAVSESGEEAGCGGCCGDDSEEAGCGGCCGDDEGEAGCGGCGGGCHTPQIIMEGKNAGKTVRVHYRGTLNDGTQFDASYDRGEPLEFICGAGMMIPGFDKAVLEMEIGQEVDVHLTPDEAYGQPDPAAVFTIGIAQLPGAEDLTVGQKVHLMNQMGQPIPVKVAAKDDETITFDANHELAGQDLNFHIELVEIL